MVRFKVLIVLILVTIFAALNMARAESGAAFTSLFKADSKFLQIEKAAQGKLNKFVCEERQINRSMNGIQIEKEVTCKILVPAQSNKKTFEDEYIDFLNQLDCRLFGCTDDMTDELVK